MGLGLLIGLYNVSSSGPLWPDAPRYANGGAMIHDWLCSGELLHPYQFAKSNYAQYPGFSIPYHPPGYPGLLGLWFLLVGMSYVTARCFIAVCLGAAGCFFHGILRRLGAASWIAMVGSLLLVTTPEIARWSRSTMSETPALMFILAASYCFLRWADTDRAGWCWGAFGLAEIAFLCRVTTAGVLPAWFLLLIFKKEFRRVLSPHLIIPSVFYLFGNAAWIKFAVTYARFEVTGPTFNRVARLSWQNFLFLPSVIPGTIGWITAVAALIGLVLVLINQRSRNFAGFWFFWLACYYVFHLVIPNNLEPRYFVAALPALCGLAVCVLALDGAGVLVQSLKGVLIAGAIAANLFQLTRQPSGLVGYQTVADRVSRLNEPGNLLLSCWWDQDLIFRFRCRPQQYPRRIIRGDRSLTIRLPAYAGIAAKPLATTSDDVLDVIRRGRVRYLLTCPRATPDLEDRPGDMVLAHATATSMPRHFERLGTFELVTDFARHHRWQVCLWRYRGKLPPGPSEIPVVIPTAGMTFQPPPDIEGSRPATAALSPNNQKPRPNPSIR